MKNIVIKNGMVLEDTPQYKIINTGRNSVTDSEILATLISSGNHSKDLAIARNILNECSNNLNELGKLSCIKLQSFGISSNKAAQVIAAIELGRRRNESEALKKGKISTSRDLFEVLNPRLSDKIVETFTIVYLNKGSKILKVIDVSTGGITGTVVDIKIILKHAIELTSSAIVLSHNHPSGNLTPSEADISITKKLVNAAKFLDIQLLDHIIVGDNDYYSFADNGMIN